MDAFVNNHELNIKWVKSALIFFVQECLKGH